MTTTRALDALRAMIADAMRADDDAAFDRIIAAIDDDPEFAADPISIAFRALSLSDRATFLIDYDRCPIHNCDFDICDDDDMPECAPIRAILDLEIAAQRAAIALFRPHS